MRISPYTIAFSRPNAAKDMFTVGKGFRKTNFYWVFPPPENPDIFTEIREWKHAQMKRFAVTPYSLNTMQKMVPVIDEVQDLLQEKLDGFAGQACDLGDWLHYFAFDVSWIDPLAWLRWSPPPPPPSRSPGKRFEVGPKTDICGVRFSARSHSLVAMDSSSKVPMSKAVSK